MTSFSVPSRELAEKLLTRLAGKDVATACSADPYSGPTNYYIYSLEEMASFLNVDMDSIANMAGTIHFIDPEVLAEWIRNTYGDEELADAISKQTTVYKNCQDSVEYHIKQLSVINPVKELLARRLEQCREVLGKESKV